MPVDDLRGMARLSSSISPARRRRTTSPSSSATLSGLVTAFSWSIPGNSCAYARPSDFSSTSLEVSEHLASRYEQKF